MRKFIRDRPTSTTKRDFDRGKLLTNEGSYSEAEDVRQLVRRQEETLEPDHRDTLESKFWLVVALFRQKKYSEAEELAREVERRQEETLGLDHKKTLESKQQLGLVLSYQGKNREAEDIFRQVVRRQEETLGLDHKETLESKQQLGLVLSYQGKNREAEDVFRQLVRRQEETLGPDYGDTLSSKDWLGEALCKQGKYSEAEEVFRQLVHGREQTLGPDHKQTLDSKHWLGLALYWQRKSSEAEEVLRQTVRRQEQTLGSDHIDTCWSRYGLGKTLHHQMKYSEADWLLRQVLQQWEKVRGVNHKDTLACKELLQQVVHANTPSAITASLKETETGRLIDFFANDSYEQMAYTDFQIEQVARLLRQVNQQWSKVPRLYIVLRTIDCLTVIDTFIDLGYSDHWLPFTEKGLPSCLRPSERSKFVTAQNRVMTKSMDLEKGKHCHIQGHDSLPLEMKGILGSGGFGQVDRVLSTISFREYALKRVSRRNFLSGRTADAKRRKECVKQFIAEIKVLKRLRHRHVVDFIGSYTDSQHIGLIMSPIADMDLSTYLTRADIATFGELRTFFGCLVRALEFMHGQSIRHKDIKPQNILIHSGNVLFTDFGLALDFTDQEGSTTTGMVNGWSPKYCSPEVADYEPRNTSSDIWSLGVVFLEMVAVLKGKTIEQVYKFLREHGSKQAFVRSNLAGMHILVAHLEERGSTADNAVLGWVQDMVQPQPQERPTATSLMISINSAGQQLGHGAFCGICCASKDDSASDLDEYFDELDISDPE